MKTIAGSVLACSLFASAVTGAEPPPRNHSNIERLSSERLAAVHADVENSSRSESTFRPGVG
jgi:hypothetical protein